MAMASCYHEELGVLIQVAEKINCIMKLYWRLSSHYCCWDNSLHYPPIKHKLFNSYLIYLIDWIYVLATKAGNLTNVFWLFIDQVRDSVMDRRGNGSLIRFSLNLLAAVTTHQRSYLKIPLMRKNQVISYRKITNQQRRSAQLNLL